MITKTSKRVINEIKEKPQNEQISTVVWTVLKNRYYQK